MFIVAIYYFSCNYLQSLFPVFLKVFSGTVGRSINWAACLSARAEADLLGESGHAPLERSLKTRTTEMRFFAHFIDCSCYGLAGFGNLNLR